MSFGRSISVDRVHAWCLKNAWMLLESLFLELSQPELVSLCCTSDSDSASGESSEPDPSHQEQQHLQSQHCHHHHSDCYGSFCMSFRSLGFGGFFVPLGVYPRFNYLKFLHCFLPQEAWSWNWAVTIARYPQQSLQNLQWQVSSSLYVLSYLDQLYVNCNHLCFS